MSAPPKVENEKAGNHAGSFFLHLGPLAGTRSGGRYRVRTCDPYHVKVVLYR